MTSDTSSHREKIRISGALRSGILSFITLSALTLSVLAADRISEGVRLGILLCGSAIIPAVFPFMIISDAVISCCDFGRLKHAGSLFERVFHIPGAGISAFICGILCGFPLGAKCATELYSQRKITRDEAEVLIAFSNNTGPAFIISGIGTAMRGSTKDGVILYLVTVISAITVGFIFRPNRIKCSNLKNNIKQTFSFVSSVRAAGINTVIVCAYILFFSAVSNIIRTVIGDGIICGSVLSFLEVGNAAHFLSSQLKFSQKIAFPMTAFAVAFSGISVHMQAATFVLPAGLRMKKYALIKFVQGLIAALISFGYALYAK